MRSLHLTIMIFCHVLLASFVLYSQLASGSPVVPPVQQVVLTEQQKPSVAEANSKQAVSSLTQQHTQAISQSQPIEAPKVPVVAAYPVPVVQKELPSRAELFSAVQPVKANEETKVASANKKDSPAPVREVAPVEAKSDAVKPVVAKGEPASSVPAKYQSPNQVASVNEATVVKKQPVSVSVNELAQRSREEAEKKPSTLEQVVAAHPLPVPVPVQVVDQAQIVQSDPILLKRLEQPSYVVGSVKEATVERVERPLAVAAGEGPPTVNGGLGPLHLLATTLCSYQPERAAADETLNQLYARRASVRKSLFDFMSLKFTNLEKLSSRLNPGLEVVPPKPSDPNQPSVVPSHGWPLVGKCTAHDLKLMAEAAWCECAEEPACASKTSDASLKPPASGAASKPSSTEALDKETPAITSNHHQRARSLEQQQVALVSNQTSAIVTKLLHVNDVKDAPVIESSLANLNLTQQQLASIQAQASSTRECRRNSLRLTKALFNHLAEDQKSVSESWPKLYALLSEDDCARKRMVDVVTALSGFRSESTSIRRDNVEFAFAMDDLRAKVLESEVNVPLTFDKEFIEVGQFLQQSVKLMLANIDPERARLTSMRYRSYMPGPVSADDQCIELHQRLLAKNYPSDCNPTQFGQLPDVLRMAASSLELWSIENELSKYSQKTLVQDYSPPCAAAAKKTAINECIANLVSS